jgi:hypothetical protein
MTGDVPGGKLVFHYSFANFSCEAHMTFTGTPHTPTTADSCEDGLAFRGSI